MNNSKIQLPEAFNEPVKMYSPESPEREALQKELARQMDIQVDIPMIINPQVQFLQVATQNHI